MDWPPVIALIITYKRLPLALATIKSVKEMVDYPNIGFHIADDGSGEDYVNRLAQEIGGNYSITVSNAARGGVGKNMNLGIAACLGRADFWLHLEDDWALKRRLDLRPCVQLMIDNQTIGMIAMGNLIAGLKAESMAGANKLWWKYTKLCQTYVFNGNASLRHRRFHQAYGQYKEGLSPGQTELGYCWQFNHITGPDIVWPAWISCEESFKHIGDHQSYKWWMETGGLTAEKTAEKFAEMDTVKI